MARLLIVTADDFGYTSGVNAGIARAHREGIVTATSVMANMPAAGEAPGYRNAQPALRFGVHLTLTAGRPLTPPEQVPSLVDGQGRFLRRDALLRSARPEEVALECRAQVAAVEALGIEPSHLDSHHHVHGFEPIVGVVKEIARERRLPVRPTSEAVRDSLRAAGIATADHLFDPLYSTDDDKTARLVGCLETLAEGLSELICHPGEPDEALAAASSYVAPRAAEVAALTSEQARLALERLDIRLVTYEALQGT